MLERERASMTLCSQSLMGSLCQGGREGGLYSLSSRLHCIPSWGPGQWSDRGISSPARAGQSGSVGLLSNVRCFLFRCPMSNIQISNVHCPMWSDLGINEHQPRQARDFDWGGQQIRSGEGGNCRRQKSEK